MSERFVYQLIGAILFGSIMETVWRNAPSLTVFVAMVMLAQIYIHSFPREVRIVKKETKFAKAMQMFKK